MVLQRLRDLLQAHVAGRVAQRVVVQLEVVDVEHDQRQRLRVADRALPFLVEEGVEVAPVGDLRQRIEQGGALQRVLGLLVVRDVVQQGDEQAVGRVHRRHRQVHRAQIAVAVADFHFARAVAVQRGDAAGARGLAAVEQVVQRAADQLFRRIAQVAVARRVGVLHAAVALDDQEALVHAVDDHAQAVGLFRLRVRAAAQAQLGAHAGAHFLQAQRLRDVVGGPRVEAGDDVFRLAARAHEDDRDAGRERMRLQAAARLQAVDAGHDDVEQDQVRLDALGDVQRAVARGGEERLIALAQHHRPQHAEVVGRVVDDEDGRLALVGNRRGR